MKLSGRFAWIALIVFFFLFVTRTEFPSLGTFAGLSYLLRDFALVVLIALLAIRWRLRIRPNVLVISLLLAFVFLVINATAFGPFCVIAAAAIVLGLNLGGAVQGKGVILHLQLVRIYLTVNLMGLALAVIFYYGAGLAIDFHSLMFPWSVSRVSEFVGVFRVTGFQIEPGTYTATIYLCTLISGILRRRLYGPLELAAVLSTVITFSAWAALVVASYLAAIVLEQLTSRSVGRVLNRFLILLIVLIPITGVVIMLDVGSLSSFQYFFSRFDIHDTTGSMSMKLQAWDAWVEQFKLGMLAPHALADSYCPHCYSPQDLGTAFNMLWYWGVFGFALFLIALIPALFRNGGLALLVLSLPLVVAKYFFFDPVLWYFFGLAFFLRPRVAMPRYHHEARVS